MTDVQASTGGLTAPPADNPDTAGAEPPRRGPVSPARRKLDAATFRAKLSAEEIDAAQRPELIEGVLARRGVASPLHERVRMRLANMFSTRVADHLLVVDETRLVLSEDTVLEPDILVFPRKLISPLVRGEDAVLVAEINTAPGGAFIAARAPIYARHGVRELHVVDLAAGETHLFVDPQDGRYRRTESVGPGSEALSAACPGLAYSLAGVLKSLRA